jgi:hypothetical protein
MDVRRNGQEWLMVEEILSGHIGNELQGSVVTNDFQQDVQIIGVWRHEEIHREDVNIFPEYEQRTYGRNKNAQCISFEFEDLDKDG